uniref:Uncharacterized protein n=1 Tax=Vitis vinifera TaxID=29760 RepID=A5B2M6_VITVI|nr:hypothetical protein VITISV_022700 [Vitis vinifera]
MGICKLQQAYVSHEYSLLLFIKAHIHDHHFNEKTPLRGSSQRRRFNLPLSRSRRGRYHQTSRLRLPEHCLTLSSAVWALGIGVGDNVVKKIVRERPDFSWKKDSQGCTPLHLACSKGHLEITRELLRLDPDLTSLQDNDGRTPLHWAAMKGRVNIIDEILSISLQSAEMRTEHGETVLHLGLKNNQYEAVKYLKETLNSQHAG